MALEREIITHPLWGKIIITYNPKARRITMRARYDGIYITMPPYASKKELEKALEIHGERLQEQQKKNQPLPIEIGYSIETPFFRFNLQALTKRIHA